jgi:hypothetical protein
MTDSGQSDTVGRSQLALKAGRPGYYVVNSATGLAISGPFQRQDVAVQEAAWQNRQDDAPPDPFEVLRVIE